MARNDRGFFHLDDVDADAVLLAFVTGQRESDGTKVDDGAAGEANDVDVVDVFIPGFDSSKRTGVPVGTGRFEFEFTDTLAS